MTNKFGLCCALSFFIANFVATSTAHADDSSDMFYGGDANHAPDRPWTGRETAPVRADIFNPQTAPQPDDVFPHAQQPNAGDMLAPNSNHVPDDPLYATPQDGVFPRH